MSSSAPTPPWSDFTEDPRTPHAAMLRASDRDRAVVVGVLTEAYADGRLDREEHEERNSAALATKTLGGLAGLILDLVPQTPTRAHREALARAAAEERDRQAVRRWESQRRHAVTRFLLPTLICWAVWARLPGSDDGWPNGLLPWPAFVMIFTGIGLLRVLLHKQDIIARERARLERRQRHMLESRRGQDPSAG